MVLLEPPPENKKPLFARSGWEIPCAVTPNQDSKLVLIRAKTLMNPRPNVRLRSGSGYAYNCVGMIFAARRAWVEIDLIYAILREDGYRSVPLNECVPGDVIVYSDNQSPQHVALVIEVARVGNQFSTRVLSKWGKDAEFEHFMEDVPPQCGNRFECYTERIV